MADGAKVERLVNLTAALLDTSRPLTRDQLVREVPGYADDEVASRRTFERDKELLRAMGIPLVTEPLDPAYPDEGVGYRIRREDYALADPGLAPDELAALHLAVSTVRLGDSEGHVALWKLGGVPASSGPPSTEAALPGDEHLPVLFQAVYERRPLRFEHRGVARRVDPWGLSFRGGQWYLSGWDHDRADHRSFRVDRITSAPEPGPPGAFDRPEPDGAGGGGRAPWTFGDEEPVDVDVLVDADHATRVEAAVGSSQVTERRDDGGIVLRLRVTNREGLRTFVLDLLDHGEVLAPPDIRAEVVAWLEALMA